MFIRSSARRVALVIGNASYGQDIGTLQNAANDAREIAKKLRSLGFEVHGRYNLDQDGMEKAFAYFIDRIGGRLRDKGPIVDDAVLYFAGHGFQSDDRNYLLPIPDETGKLGEVSLQIWITKLEKLAARRLIFLDACRDFNTTKVTLEIASTRDVSADALPNVTPGLVDQDYGSEILVSFSAAPGKKAYDGIDGSPHSPYAEALLAHIDTAEQPVSVLMGRVHKAVKERTNGAPFGQQETWSSFAMSQAYFFRPQSILFLLGNAMALLALLLTAAMGSLAFYAVGLEHLPGAYRSLRDGYAISALAAALFLVTLIVFLNGVARAYSRLRGVAPEWRTEEHIARHERRVLVAQGGVGGLLGAIIASPIISLTYLWQWRFNSELEPWECQTLWFAAMAEPNCPNGARVIVEVAAAGVFIAAILGTIALSYATRADSVATQGLTRSDRQKRTLIAAAKGGLIAGAICGPLVAAYFGQFYRPFLEPSFVWAFAAISVAIIAFSIVNYSLDRFSTQRFLTSAAAALTATIVTGLALGAAVWVLNKIGFINGILYWARDGFENDSYSLARKYAHLVAAGVPYGLVFGPFLGVLIGMTRLLTVLWERR